MRRTGALVALLCLLPLSAPPAQPAGAVETDRLSAAREQALATASAREARFTAARDAARAALASRRGTLNRLQAQHRELQDALAAGEARRPQLERRLASGSDDQQRLFEVARLAARDAIRPLARSPANLGKPDRIEGLHALASDTGPMSPEQIESLWLTLLEEMTRSAQITRGRTTVVDADGEESQRAVLTIGSIGAYSEGALLTMPGADGGAARAVPAPGWVTRRLRGLETGRGDAHGMVDVLVDPTLGALMAAEAARPTPLQVAAAGGVIGLTIMVLGGFGLALAAVRWTALWRFARRQPFDRIDEAYRAAATRGTDDVALALDEQLVDEATKLEQGQALIKLLAATCPLLGLLGTITAIIGMFRLIAVLGTGDPASAADGIGLALVTTGLGISAAVMLALAHAAVAGRSRAMIEGLETRVAGLVASHKAARRAAGQSRLASTDQEAQS